MLQWNVWIEENPRDIAKFLKVNPADIICLQELTHGYLKHTPIESWSYLASELGYSYRVQTIPISSGDNKWTQANGIFTKFEITKTRELWLSGFSHETSTQPRGYLEVTINTSHGNITVATTHLSFPSQPKELGNFQDIVNDADRPYILTGDFNLLPDSDFIAQLNEKLTHAGPDLQQNNWPTRSLTIDGENVPALSKRLDYVYCTSDLEIIKSAFLGSEYSDHLPIFVKFKLH